MTEVDVKKLAERVGFTQVKAYWAGSSTGWQEVTGLRKHVPGETQIWRVGNKFLGRKLPDFPNDLDACFEWLVPELVGIHMIGISNKYWCLLAVVNSKGKAAQGEATEETPALAICKAFEQMIDSEI